MAASRSHVVFADDEAMRIDMLCADKGFYQSRAAAVRAIEAGRVLVNGSPVVKKHLVSAGDVIVYELDEPQGPRGVALGEPIPLDVRYEDDYLLVISKQAGLVCHPTENVPDGTLVNALIYHYGYDHLCNVQGDDDRLGIVHRLDRDTTGLMLAAKTDEAGIALMEQIRAREVERRYLALVHGIIAIDNGMVDAPIARDPSDRLKKTVRADLSSSRDAVTTFKVLERFPAETGDDGYTLIECKLFTGRTHQIRVHMQYTHHPLVGDPLYTAHAPKNSAASLGLKRQFLHSYHLGFTHPITGEAMTFIDGLPADLQAALTALELRDGEVAAEGHSVFSAIAEAPKPAIEGEIDV